MPSLVLEQIRARYAQLAELEPLPSTAASGFGPPGESPEKPRAHSYGYLCVWIDGVDVEIPYLPDQTIDEVMSAALEAYEAADPKREQVRAIGKRRLARWPLGPNLPSLQTSSFPPQTIYPPTGLTLGCNGKILEPGAKVIKLLRAGDELAVVTGSRKGSFERQRNSMLSSSGDIVGLAVAGSKGSIRGTMDSETIDKIGEGLAAKLEDEDEEEDKKSSFNVASGRASVLGKQESAAESDDGVNDNSSGSFSLGLNGKASSQEVIKAERQSSRASNGSIRQSSSSSGRNSSDSNCSRSSSGSKRGHRRSTQGKASLRNSFFSAVSVLEEGEWSSDEESGSDEDFIVAPPRRSNTPRNNGTPKAAEELEPWAEEHDSEIRSEVDVDQSMESKDCSSDMEDMIYQATDDNMHSEALQALEASESENDQAAAANGEPVPDFMDGSDGSDADDSLEIQRLDGQLGHLSGEIQDLISSGASLGSIKRSSCSSAGSNLDVIPEADGESDLDLSAVSEADAAAAAAADAVARARALAEFEAEEAEEEARAEAEARAREEKAALEQAEKEARAEAEARAREEMAAIEQAEEEARVVARAEAAAIEQARRDEEDRLIAASKAAKASGANHVQEQASSAEKTRVVAEAKAMATAESQSGKEMGRRQPGHVRSKTSGSGAAVLKRGQNNAGETASQQAARNAFTATHGARGGSSTAGKEKKHRLTKSQGSFFRKAFSVFEKGKPAEGNASQVSDAVNKAKPLSSQASSKFKSNPGPGHVRTASNSPAWVKETTSAVVKTTAPVTAAPAPAPVSPPPAAEDQPQPLPEAKPAKAKRSGGRSSVGGRTSVGGLVIVPYEELKGSGRDIPGVNYAVREQHLSAAEFQSIFKMTRAEFNKMPKWKKMLRKKSVDLF
ncbi:unnamed protein product [Chrysoparadoxa australica]